MSLTAHPIPTAAPPAIVAGPKATPAAALDVFHAAERDAVPRAMGGALASAYVH